MQIDINIEQIVAESVAAALHPEKIQPIIEKNVQDAVKGAIEKQFSYSSPFKKALEEKLTGIMPTDFGDLGRYGDLVMKTVTGMLNDRQDQAVNQTIKEKLEAMLSPFPDRMKLTEVVGKLVLAFANSYDREGSDRPTIIIESCENDGLTPGYWHFFADPKRNQDKYSCKVHMSFNPEGECYSLKFGDYDPRKSLLLGKVYGAEALILGLYTGGVKIEREDIYTDDIYYSDSEY